MKTVTYGYENMQRVITLLNSIEVRGTDNCRMMGMAADLIRSPIREGEEKPKRKEVEADGSKESGENAQHSV